MNKNLSNMLVIALFFTGYAHAASWQDSLNSAASQLSGSSTQAGSGGISPADI